MIYTAYVVELKSHRYKVYIDDVCISVTAKTYSAALCSVIDFIFGDDCDADYDFYAVGGGLRSGQPFVQYYVSIDD